MAWDQRKGRRYYYRVRRVAVRTVSGSEDRVVRGGAYDSICSSHCIHGQGTQWSLAGLARSAKRDPANPGLYHWSLGLRPARP